MIYTTFNPALIMVKVANVDWDVNRTIRNIFTEARRHHVSALLANLGYRGRLWDSLPVLRGRDRAGVRSLGLIQTLSRWRSSAVPHCVKLKSDQESEINGMGPRLQPAMWTSF